MPEREDDPSIGPEENLLRRIVWKHAVPDDHGNLRISSAAFRDPNQELSINLQSTMQQAGREPVDAVRNYPGYGLASITAGQARSQIQKVCRDPQLEEPAHGLVCGNQTRAVGKSLSTCAQWILKPQPPDDAPPLANIVQTSR